MCQVTVFTPTYNRAHTLEACYESLCRQTSVEFIWIIVDDGSIDETSTLINMWISEDIIKIKYYWQPNQGKHIAFNTGVSMADGELFLCLDSDDILLDNAIEVIIKKWGNSNNHYAGMIACKSNMKGLVVGSMLPEKLNASTVYDLYNIFRVQGDKLMIFNANIIKKYQYPVIEGEKFVTEAFIYDQIDKNYEWLLLNEVLYQCEYLSDGYTANDKQLLLRNPKGFAMYFRNRIKIGHSFKARYLFAVRYVNCNFISKNKYYLKDSPAKLITMLAIPTAIVIYFYKYSKYNTD